MADETHSKVALEAMEEFWGRSSGSNEQLGLVAEILRKLDKGQLQFIGACIPQGNHGTLVGDRCDRLRTLVSGILAEV